MRRLLIPVLLIPALLAAAAGCGGRDEDRACERMDDHDRERPGGVTVLLADVSASVRGGAGGPDYSAALVPQVEAAVERGDTVYVGSFDGSSSTVSWTAERKLTHSDAKREKPQRYDRDAFKRCLGESVRAAVTASPGTGGTDLLGALDTAAQAARRTGAEPRTVVLATDGLSTAGCFNLTGGDAGKDSWITTLVSACSKRTGWPRDLAGARMLMVGVGQASASQATLSSGNVRFLRSLWQRACETAKATACDVSALPVARTDDDGEANLPEDPDVAFAPDAGPPPPDVYPVSTSLLFETDSSVVLPAGRRELTTLAEKIVDGGAASVKVVGYADIRDTEAHNQRLSERRAAAVAEVLEQAGVAGVVSEGRGEKDAGCPTESCMHRDRRVEIVVTRTEG
ncbi:OmpA family protein [Actinoplanes sp. NPDC051861]|uniref:OmpA family protein n=1 Tax=Actinoplanes sp. NPDC051861 TaxID=3155170 RepID=UPI00342CF5E2